MFVGRQGSVGNELFSTNGLAYSGAIDASGTNALQLGVNDSAAITILNGGNVGIGTTNPGYKLDVAGDINLSANQFIRIDGSAALGGNGSSFIRLGTTDVLDLQFFAGSATQRMMILNSTGNVGIGTTAPSTLITQSTTSASSTFTGESTNASAIDNGWRFNCGVKDDSGSTRTITSIIHGCEATHASAPGGYIDFYTRATGGSNTKNMRLDNAGKLSLTSLTANTIVITDGSKNLISGPSLSNSGVTSTVTRIAWFSCSTSATWTITHNFGTRDVGVQIFRNSGVYDTVSYDVERTDTNTVTIRLLTAPSSGAFRACVFA